MPNKELTQEEYVARKKFVSGVDTLGTSKNSDRWGYQIEEKRRLLASTGIHGLIVGKNEERESKSLPLEDCNDKRVHEALFHTYERYQSQIARYEQEKISRTDQAGYTNLVILIQAERQAESLGELEMAMERTGIAMDNASEGVLERISSEFGQEVIGDFLSA
jgi:hypothetical protein